MADKSRSSATMPRMAEATSAGFWPETETATIKVRQTSGWTAVLQNLVNR
jgi:hypothetical protein